LPANTSKQGSRKHNPAKKGVGGAREEGSLKSCKADEDWKSAKGAGRPPFMHEGDGSRQRGYADARSTRKSRSEDSPGIGLRKKGGLRIKKKKKKKKKKLCLTGRIRGAQKKRKRGSPSLTTRKKGGQRQAPRLKRAGAPDLRDRNQA